MYVASAPEMFCGRSPPQSSSARRSLGTGRPRATSRISSTCLGLIPPKSRGPSARSPARIARGPNIRISMVCDMV